LFVPEVKDEKRIPPDGKLIVTRTRDGGKSFDVLTKGLPQSHAYDVVYRHALALDEAGDRLAFGSTTGGLWVSDDQGDSWACVTHHPTANLFGAVRMTWRGRQPALRNVSTTLLADRASVIVQEQRCFLGFAA
jgi:hypothetical protein